MSAVLLTLIGKPGCHLCDDARARILEVMERLGAEPSAPEIRLEELSILEDADLHDRHWEEIPVLQIDGRTHTYWRVDPARLEAALRERGVPLAPDPDSAPKRRLRGLWAR